MARERTWNSRRKGGSHAHTSQVFEIVVDLFILIFFLFVASVIHMVEKIERMSSGEKIRGKYYCCLKRLNNVPDSDP
jgi:hypothetical protein